MTYEEALNFPQKWTEEQAVNDLERYLLRKELPAMKAVAVCMQAAKKQIPKKPKPHIVQPVEAPIKIGCGRWGKGTTVYKCPNCKEWVSKIYKHCAKCGQALDWK